MNVINKEIYKGNDKEEPIFTIDLRCCYDDYLASLKTQLYFKNSKRTAFFKVFSIFSCIMIIVLIATFIFGRSFKLIFESIVICGVVIYTNIYIWDNYKKQKIPYFKTMLKQQSAVFKDRSIEEIKKIIIPCRLCFYDTYLTKAAPSVEKTKSVSPEEIINLPLEAMVELEYKRFHKPKETDECIWFYPRIFVPKTNLSEQDKEKLKIIKEKIILAKIIR